MLPASLRSLYWMDTDRARCESLPQPGWRRPRAVAPVVDRSHPGRRLPSGFDQRGAVHVESIASGV